MATDKNQMSAFWQLWDAHPQYIIFGLIVVSLAEAISGIATTTGRESGQRAPGDFNFDPLNYSKGDPAKYAKLQEQEVANGRLAMFGASGALLQGMTHGPQEGILSNMMTALRDNSF